jgi:hypothetical protein
MKAREHQRRTYEPVKEQFRLDVCRSTERILREQRDLLVHVGADAAANAVRIALKSIGGAIRHAEHRLRFAQAAARGEE